MAYPTPELVAICPDPECLQPSGHRSPAEPEQDGDYRYWTCTSCGYSFGYHRPATAVTDDTCAVGIPESLRRRASAAAHRGQPPLLQIGRHNDGRTP